MNKLEEAQAKLAEQYKLRATLNTMLSEKAELMERSRRDHRTAVLAKKADAELKRFEDEIAEAQRVRGRLEILLAAAGEEIPKLEAERDQAARVDALERLKEKARQIVRVVGTQMDDSVRRLAAAQAEVDSIVADAARIAQTVGVSVDKASRKVGDSGPAMPFAAIRKELARALNWQIFGDKGDHGEVFGGVQKRHYSMPLAKIIEGLLLGGDESRSGSAEDKVVKLTDAEKKAS